MVSAATSASRWAHGRPRQQMRRRSLGTGDHRWSRRHFRETTQCLRDSEWGAVSAERLRRRDLCPAMIAHLVGGQDVCLSGLRFVPDPLAVESIRG